MVARAYVAHLDADCFYVSAERVRHPDLAGKPVGVLGNNGACVIAKSYEMKASGVKTGTPIWDAARLCPDGVYIKRDFRWYEVLSRKMLAAVADHADVGRPEYYSIDEFFFHAAPLRAGQPLAAAVAAVRDRVLERVGVPVTIAAARTRTLAKLFSDTAKPFGARAVTDRDHERELLSKLPVTEVSGVAGRRAARLAPYGIRTCLDLADADGRLVHKLLTKTGYELWLELNGTPAQIVREQRADHKVLARGGSLMGKVADPKVLWAWCVRNLERLIEELRFHRVRAGGLAVEVSYRDGGGLCGAVPLAVPTAEFGRLTEAAAVALRRAFRPDAEATHMHVIASPLRRGPAQPGLFDAPDPRAEAVARVKDEVNAEFGRFALRSGATLHLPAVYADPANDFDICDVRGKVCF